MRLPQALDSPSWGLEGLVLVLTGNVVWDKSLEFSGLLNPIFIIKHPCSILVQEDGRTKKVGWQSWARAPAPT